MLAMAPIPLLLSLPGLLLGFVAQFMVRSAWSKYSEEAFALGVPGAQVARYILDSCGLANVKVEETRGFLSDHYDPSRTTVRLSSQVYQGCSIAAIGVAAHEVGHALQHSGNYRPLMLRSGMVPSVQFSSWLAPIFFTVGLAVPHAWGQTLAFLGLILFGLTVLFALITLPVEFDASKRARQLLVDEGLVTDPQELGGVKTVLNAAALSYVAAAVQAFMALFHYLYLFLTHRRENKKEQERVKAALHSQDAARRNRG